MRRINANALIPVDDPGLLTEQTIIYPDRVEQNASDMHIEVVRTEYRIRIPHGHSVELPPMPGGSLIPYQSADRAEPLLKQIGARTGLILGAFSAICGAWLVNQFRTEDQPARSAQILSIPLGEAKEVAPPAEAAPLEVSVGPPAKAEAKEPARPVMLAQAEEQPIQVSMPLAPPKRRTRSEPRVLTSDAAMKKAFDSAEVEEWNEMGETGFVAPGPLQLRGNMSCRTLTVWKSGGAQGESQTATKCKTSSGDLIEP